MPPTDGLNEGDVFAGYTIVRLLGAGGMGEVYLARHPRLPRHDALKILPAHLTADDEYRQRFSREADMAAGLSHPNIVGIHDRGEFEGQLWLSMEFVAGIDAAYLLKSRYRSGMPQQQVLEIVTAVADALDYAHSRGLLHRDVKPANILLDDSGTRRRVKLADFGIARQLGDISGLTATNMMVGTTAYCAPEQLQGLNLDGRADEYALGCTAFHLFTGSAPFEHSNPAVVITQHLSAPRPQVADRRPELVGLNDVLARAIAKDPAHRYPSCSDFAAALVGDQPPTAPAPTVAQARGAAAGEPPTTVLPAPRRRRRRPVTLAIGVAAVVLVALVAVIGGRILHRHSSQPGDAAPSTSMLPSTEGIPPTSAPSAPSIQLSRYVTDQAGVLAPPGHAAVERALNKLYAARNVHLWVVYVNTFSGLTPLKWAEETMRANNFTKSDALLAIATDERRFSFRVPAALTDGTSINLAALRRDRIEPAVSRAEWPRAAMAAASGLETTGG
jgi:serine/threonine protein kinase, bacterial